MLTRVQAAQYGLLANYAMDMFLADRASLTPKPDPRLAPAWTIVGYLTAVDYVGRLLSQTVCYGFLARSASEPSQFVAVIRGTGDILEWIEDALFAFEPHPVAGKVESGFFGVYRSMKYHTVAVAASAAQAIATVVGFGSVTVIGHSLGSAIATYLAFDLAGYLGPRVSACLLASPRPGDAVFAQAFDKRVTDYTLFNYVLDAVPHVPLGFAPLPRAIWISADEAQARIKWSLGCNHHALCYAAMLDYSLADWPAVPQLDQQYAACIKGPAIS